MAMTQLGLTEMKDALEGVTGLGYDLNGNLVSGTDANGHSESCYYDVLGQLLTQTDAAGNVTAMEYDAVGNISR